MKARDAGGSMVIHTFGGYYGLSISWMLYRPNLDQSSRLQGSVYHSDVFAMIGENEFQLNIGPHLPFFCYVINKVSVSLLSV